MPSIFLHYSVNFSLTMLGLSIPALSIMLAACAALILVLDRGVGWFRPPRQCLPRLDKWRRWRL